MKSKFHTCTHVSQVTTIAERSIYQIGTVSKGTMPQSGNVFVEDTRHDDYDSVGVA